MEIHCEMEPSSEDEEEEANATCYSSQAHVECNGTNGVVSKPTTMPGSGSCATLGSLPKTFSNLPSIKI